MVDYPEEVDPESEVNQKLKKIKEQLEGRKRLHPHLQDTRTLQYSIALIFDSYRFEDAYPHIFCEVAEVCNRLDFDVYVSQVQKTGRVGVKISLKKEE